MNHDVFISFSFADQAVSEKLVQILLDKYGITSWICTRELDGGSLFKAEIPGAIDRSRVVVLMQSRSAVESREIPKEIHIAFNGEKTIIPFRLDETPLERELRYDLSGVEYIDGTIPSFEDRVEDLARSIKRALEADGPVVSGLSAKPVYKLMPTPFSCSEIFFGRDEEMAALHKAFEDRNTIILRGMGGIGKSEFARQYTRRYRADYDCVVFARYDGSIASLLANDAVLDVKGLVRRINADGTQESDEEYAAKKLEIINSISNQRTLLILDNFDATSDPMLEDLASNKNYRLIITSRLEPEHGKYYVQPVAELDEETLRDMVVEFANPQTTMVDRDDPDFPELFEMTHCHTLTLELIGKYMEEQCIDEIGEMIGLLKKHNIGILENSENAQRAAAIRGLFRMTEMSPNEQNFLRWLALTPPEGIGHKLFRDLVGTEVFTSRTRLASLGLVRLDGVSKKISLHPIVRQTVYNELKATLENSEAFFENVKASCYASWNWTLAQKLMIAESSDVIIDQLGEVNDNNFDLYYTLGINRNFVFTKSKVLPFWDKLYKYALKSFGEDSLQAGLVAYRAGWFCQYCDLEAMRFWLEDRAYPILKANREKAPSEFPHAITNIATCYRKMHDADPKQEYFDKAVKYCDEALVEMTRSHEEAVANGNEAVERKTYIMTGGVYMVQAMLGIKSNDIEYTSEVLEKIFERITPDMSADYSYCIVLKARLLYCKGDVEGAVREFEDALVRYNNVFPEINSYSMEMHVFLAKCKDDLGETGDAAMHWEKAHHMAEVLLVEGHPTLELTRKAVSK